MEELKGLNNFYIENCSSYLDTALSCDVLIADHSSILVECAVANKIIIYTNLEIELDTIGTKIIENNYVANNFDDISSILNELLKGNDPQKERRDKNKDSYFFVPPDGKSVAQYLLDILDEDYHNIPEVINYYKSIISNQEEKQEQLKVKINEVEKQLDEIYSSKLWRITKPFHAPSRKSN